MNYLITGAGFGNKGAELMLLAAIQELRRFDPEPVLVVDPCCGPYEWRARLGLRQLFDPAKSGNLSWLRKQLFHPGYRERFGLVPPSEIDVVLDLSGFSVGDQWDAAWVEAKARMFEGYRRRGARVIMLPQAFGPFKIRRIRDAARRILKAAHLIFARDHDSKVYCDEITGRPVQLGGDFTNLLEGRLPSDWATSRADVAIVPNRRMLRRETHASNTYVSLLGESIRRVAAAGYRPFVLVHERGDQEIARCIAIEGCVSDQVVLHDDPVVLKGILGSCCFSIGSRYHGLVNALSQGVPCLGTSWTHKYRHLFDDYGVTEWVDACAWEASSWHGRLSQLFEPELRAILRKTLLERSIHLVKDARNTWKLVAETSLRRD